MRNLWSSQRYILLILVFIAILSASLLTIYMITSRHDPEIFMIMLVGVIFLIVVWFGGNFLILKRINALIVQTKRHTASDLNSQSGRNGLFSFLGELDQAIYQIANVLAERDEKLNQRTAEFNALVEMMKEFAVEQDLSALLQVIAEKVMTLLKVANVTIMLYEPGVDELVVTAVKGAQVPVGLRIRVSGRVYDFATQIRESIIVNNHPTWVERLPEFDEFPISALLRVPMVYQDELIGAVGVAEIEPATRKFSQEDEQLLILFAGAAATSIKIARLFEENRLRLREMDAINEISRAARVASGINEMMLVVLEKTLDIVDASMGGIWLYNPADDILNQVVSDGIPDMEIHPRPGEGIIGTVFSTGLPYFSSDVREDPLTHISKRSRTPAGLSGAFIPIRTAEVMVGVLGIGFSAPNALTEHQIQLVTTISENAGNAIHRAHLYEKMKHQLQRLDALHHIDLAITSSLDLENILQVLLDQVVTQLGMDAACVLVLNPDDKTFEFGASHGFNTDALRFTRLKFGEGFAGQAAAKLQRIHIPDLNSHYTDSLRSPSFTAEGFVTYYAVPLVTRTQVKGVLEVFHRSPFEGDLEWLDFLDTIASQAAIAIDVAALFMDLQRSNAELNLAYNSTLEGWSRALDLRDKETEGHSQRVTEMAIRLARAMSIEESDLVHIHRGSLLHDIGKLGIPDDILLKPGPLNEEEIEKIRKHPEIAYKLLAPITYLRSALDIPYCHHEKWDGSGYPRGLKGEEIPFAARIFAVVDVWDALTSDRPYRKSWSEDKAREYLHEQAGHHFDPRIVDIFLSMLNGDDDTTNSPESE